MYESGNALPRSLDGISTAEGIWPLTDHKEITSVHEEHAIFLHWLQIYAKSSTDMRLQIGKFSNV